jgi:hypothetical protein
MWVRVACRVAYGEEQRTVATSFRGISMIICDLCGGEKDCLQKEIEGKDYDICSECWNPFAQKLRGKGRVKNRETVFLPPPRVIKEREDEEPEPLPGEMPKIWGAVERPH